MELVMLDRNIRNFVFIPVFLVVIFVSLLRNNLMVLLKTEPKANLQDLKPNQYIARSKLLKVNGNYLTPRGFAVRKAFYVKKDTGYFCNPPPASNPLQAMSDPSAMFGMAKQQMEVLVFNGGLFSWVHFLFSDFLVAKVPFGLTYKCKATMQRGIELPSLDVSYVSGLSWYFLVFFGAGGIVSLIQSMRGSTQEVVDLNATDLSPFGMPGAANPAGMMLPGMGTPDFKGVFQQEKTNLEIAAHVSSLDGVELRLAQRWAAARLQPAA